MVNPFFPSAGKISPQNLIDLPSLSKQKINDYLIAQFIQTSIRLGG